MRSGRRPLQNRVSPFGDVVAIAQRGLFIGNRGIIHDPATKTLLGRRWTTKAWLVCVLDYKGRHREVMAAAAGPSFSFSTKVIAQAAQYRRAGADELALSFAGPQPAADAAYFAQAVKRLIPDGEPVTDVRRSPPDRG